MKTWTDKKYCWRCSIIDLGTAYVLAPSRGKATAVTLKAAHEAGYYDVSWVEVKTRRAPEYDFLDGNHAVGRAFSPQRMEEIAAQVRESIERSKILQEVHA